MSLNQAFRATFLGPNGTGMNADGSPYAPSQTDAAALGAQIDGVAPNATSLAAVQGQINDPKSGNAALASVVYSSIAGNAALSAILSDPKVGNAALAALVAALQAIVYDPAAGNKALQAAIAALHASQADAVAGTRDDVYVTPLDLAAVLAAVGAVATAISSPDVAFQVTSADGRRLMALFRNGVAQLGDLRSYTTNNRSDLLAFVDAAKAELARFDPRGGLRHELARGSARAAIAAGARGRVHDVEEGVRTIRYRSDVHPQMPNALYSYRRDKNLPAQVYTGVSKATVFLDYGQSWRGQWGTPPAGYQNLGLQDLAFVLRNEYGSLPQVFYPQYYLKVDDVMGIAMENPGGFINPNSPPDVNLGGGAEIGMFAALAFQAFCLLDADGPSLIEPVLTWGTPQAASAWSKVMAYDTPPSANPTLWLAPGSAPWNGMLNMIPVVPKCLARYGLEPEYAGVGFTHGSYSAQQEQIKTYTSELSDMMYQFQKLGLPTGGRGLHFFTDQSPGDATTQFGFPGQADQVLFANNNAKFVHLIGPRTPYQLNTQSNPHHSALGTAEIGILEGLVKWGVLRKGLAWTPLQILSWSVAGNTLTINLSDPFADPRWGGVPAAVGGIAVDTVKMPKANGFGFRLFVNPDNQPTGERTLTAMQINGTQISFTYSGPSAQGKVNLKYAALRDANVPDDPTHVGIWGNIKAVGPADPLWSGGGRKTVDTWLCHYDQTVYIPSPT